MKIVSGKKMGEIDREAMTRYGIPGLILMENAGLQVVGLIRKLRPDRGNGSIIILCGKGNNGGDGFVIARHLKRLGYCVETWAVDPVSDYQGDAAVNYRILLNTGCEVHLVGEKYPLGRLKDLNSSDLIVDALLGTGIGRKVSGIYEELIEAINSSSASVVSVDIPSGISADSGEVMGTAVRADYTVTFALPKRGLLHFPGAGYSGRLFVADIGIPEALASSADIRENLITGDFIRSQLPQRVLESHKGTYGRVLLLAGSPGMTGAAALAGEAALRGGAGLVYAGVAGGLRAVLEAKLKEVIVLGFTGDSEGNLTIDSLPGIMEHASGCDALALGPGLKPGRETLNLLKALAREVPLPLVVDAGGLSALALEPGCLTQLEGRKASFIFTPHPGEMARMLGANVKNVQKQRWELAAQKAAEWNAVVVLKGAYTVIAVPEGEVYINPTGNPVLSSAGTGDLLTGLITAFCAQGLSPESAALCGAYLHGLAADLLVKRSGDRGFKAGDILDYFPAAFRETLNLPPVQPGELYQISR